MPSLLIIDDEPTIRILFQYVFADAGYEVRLANNGQEALDALAGAIPDFMLLDISMPVMTGTEFVENLKKLSLTKPHLKKIPFIVMTGGNFIETTINRTFKESPGFRAFVPKMTQPEQVLSMVEDILKKEGRL